MQGIVICNQWDKALHRSLVLFAVVLGLLHGVYLTF